MKKRIIKIFFSFLLIVFLTSCFNSGSSLDSSIKISSNKNLIIYKINYHLNGGTGFFINNSYNEETPTFDLPIPSKEGYVFNGWYDNELLKGEIIRKIYQGSSGDKDFWAKYDYGVEEVNEFGLVYAYLYYGSFPQTVVTDTSIIKKLNNLSLGKEEGIYLIKNQQYFKTRATFKTEERKFHNGNTIENEETYYFLFEPIKWRILKIEAGKYQVLSEYILNTKRIDANSNNYLESEIRDYLNNDFYETSFNEEEKEKILSSSDKVSLLSLNDYLDENNFSSTYGSTKERYAISTDYARAKGILLHSNETYEDVGIYWTRSEAINEPYLATYCINDGAVNYAFVGFEGGVRPSLMIEYE
ncbi:MAG: InlB B-repeat-containing protein [Bacillales bacterium]|jgi:uncharacterized repeat protein (TIGR02543 family)|nr:InlB B-repeat-containing protein [Bacillales bacterium]